MCKLVVFLIRGLCEIRKRERSCSCVVLDTSKVYYCVLGWFVAQVEAVWYREVCKGLQWSGG